MTLQVVVPLPPLVFVNPEHFLIKHSNSGDQAPIVCFILMFRPPSISDISKIVYPSEGIPPRSF